MLYSESQIRKLLVDSIAPTGEPANAMMRHRVRGRRRILSSLGRFLERTRRLPDTVVLELDTFRVPWGELVLVPGSHEEAAEVAEHVQQLLKAPLSERFGPERYWIGRWRKVPVCVSASGAKAPDFDEGRHRLLSSLGQLKELAGYLRLTDQDLRILTGSRILEPDHGQLPDPAEKLLKLLGQVLFWSQMKPGLMPTFWRQQQLWGARFDSAPWHGEGLGPFLMCRGRHGVEQAAAWIDAN